MLMHPDAQPFPDLTARSAQLDSQTSSENRANHEASRHLRRARAPVAKATDIEIVGVSVQIHHLYGQLEKPPVFIYFHGSGWVLGDLESTDSTGRDVTMVSRFVCISIDYRRAPEHPFPAAFDDALAVTKTVLNGEISLDIDFRRVAIGGDIAGGNLAAVMVQELRDHIAHQVLIYSVMNRSRMNTPGHIKFSDGYYLTARKLNYFYEAYGADHDLTDPRLSPGLNPDLNNLPSATVITAEFAPFVDEVEDYAPAMLGAGKKVNIVCFKGQVHPLLSMVSIIADAPVARRLIGTELRAALIP